ncbi:MAG TPA: aminotransferase class I/II-fold pyridoxal phosphate-dependent enzyme, partial [Paracoccaceae bacterium]|nr:aminotransferase class I/II-fold pyridoxal phosphate-dependent enzyme [Paracoccaceae bacterium]
MLASLKPQAPDKIIALIAEFAADPRAGKVDLGVGVYRDAEGRTPVMRAVKAAEERLWRMEDTKTYKALLGEERFIAAMRELVLAGGVDPERVAGAQCPGGTGALHILFELVQRAERGASVWVSDPSWPNHAAILAHLGLPMRSYRYFHGASRGVDFEGMAADLAQAGPRDVVLLHGCCHNPTGANLDAGQWAQVTGMALAQG